MTLVGFLRFAVTCFNVLAWPLCSLGYPLCASIRAIESNSNTDIQNLVTYWISFSLISLFDHAFAKLLHWNPFWPYMKLFAICWLVMPHFDGSLYVYKHFVHPCVSGMPELVMNQFSAWKEFFLSKENFVVAAERYIEENGAEALEELIANKSKCAKPKSDVKKVKAVDTNEKNAESPDCKEPIVAQSEIKKVEVTKKREAAAVEWVDKPEVNLSHTDNKTYVAAEIKGATSAESIAVKEDNGPESLKQSILNHSKETNCAFKEIKSVTDAETSAATAAEKVNCAKPNLSLTDISISNREEKKMATGASTVGNEFPELISPTVQREWTCAMCQVTTQSETTLKDHLRGKRHKINMEGLSACMMAAKSRTAAVSSSTTKKADQSSKPHLFTGRSNQSNVKRTRVENQYGAIWCDKCELWCSGAVSMISHLTGKKHLEKLKELSAGSLSVVGKSETP